MLGCLLTLGLAAAQPDLEAVAQKADALLQDARDGYEAARSRASVPEYIQAGFKLEEARIKYLVLQEVGSPEQQKSAAARLREVQQLAKLINDGKVASGKPPTPDSPPPPAPDAPASSAPPANAPAPVEEVASPRRLPVPEAASLKESEALLKELFKEAYARKDPAGRKALARLLLQQRGKVAGDAASAYVVFREAADAAVQGNDLRTALRALEEQADRFDVDGPALRAAALTKLGRTARTPGELGLVAETYLEMVDGHLAMDEYPPADKAAAAAIAFAKKSGSLPLAVLATERKKEVAEAATRFRAMKKVLETLASDPAHPESNLEMGRFLCFIKGNWDLGLRFLAQGSDDTLKGLAVAETGAPATPEEIQKIADGWFALFEKEAPSLKKKQIALHARDLYGSVMPGAAGLAALKIQKRLDALPAPEASRYGAAVDLMPLVDLSKPIAGPWNKSGGAYLCGPGPHTRVPVLYQLPDEYDLVIGLQRVDLGGSFSVGLGSQDVFFSYTLDGYAPKVNGFQMIDGRTAQDNPTTHRGSLVRNKTPITLLIRVRRDELSLDYDGRRISSFKGDFSRVGGGKKDWEIPGWNGLFIASWGSMWSVSRIELTPHSPGGRPLK